MEAFEDLHDDGAPLYRSTEFRMYCFKVLPCSKRYCHDWTLCCFAHPAEKAKRRDPRVSSYTGVACPEMKKCVKCPRGDACHFAHNVFEYWLHPSRYRTQLCNDGLACHRKICFFAHSTEELRVASVKVLPHDLARYGPDLARCTFDSPKATVGLPPKAKQFAAEALGGMPRGPKGVDTDDDCVIVVNTPQEILPTCPPHIGGLLQHINRMAQAAAAAPPGHLGTGAMNGLSGASGGVSQLGMLGMAGHSHQQAAAPQAFGKAPLQFPQAFSPQSFFQQQQQQQMFNVQQLAQVQAQSMMQQQQRQQQQLHNNMDLMALRAAAPIAGSYAAQRPFLTPDETSLQLQLLQQRHALQQQQQQQALQLQQQQQAMQQQRVPSPTNSGSHQLVNQLADSLSQLRMTGALSDPMVTQELVGTLLQTLLSQSSGDAPLPDATLFMPTSSSRGNDMSNFASQGPAVSLSSALLPQAHLLQNVSRAAASQQYASSSSASSGSASSSHRLYGQQPNLGCTQSAPVLASDLRSAASGGLCQSPDALHFLSCDMTPGASRQASADMIAPPAAQRHHQQFGVSPAQDLMASQQATTAAAGSAWGQPGLSRHSLDFPTEGMFSVGGASGVAASCPSNVLSSHRRTGGGGMGSPALSNSSLNGFTELDRLDSAATHEDALQQISQGRHSLEHPWNDSFWAASTEPAPAVPTPMQRSSRGNTPSRRSLVSCVSSNDGSVGGNLIGVGSGDATMVASTGYPLAAPRVPTSTLSPRNMEAGVSDLVSAVTFGGWDSVTGDGTTDAAYLSAINDAARSELANGKVVF